MAKKNESKQIDIILANDIGLNFKEHAKMFTAVENVAAVFTIKSNLTKKELIDSLENLASIPQISTEVIKFKSLKENAINEFVKYHPTLFIFAFEGATVKNTLETLNQFYKTKEIPFNRYPTTIVVNEKYYITFSPNQLKTAGGNIIPPYNFHPVELNKSMGGIPFFHILNDISQYQDWLSKMTINYKPYADSFLLRLYNEAKD